jgi:hypothetical protein
MTRLEKSLASGRRFVIITTVICEKNLTTAAPSDPPQDRPGPTVPERIGALLRVVRVLLGYGRHLAGTLRHRAAAPSFTTIAAGFGTADLATIAARLQRGILRALALQHLLLARAARGHDIQLAHCRSRTPGRQPPPAPRAAAPRPAAMPEWRDDPADLDTLTLQQLEAQIRRRPLGRTIVEICLDLAAFPGFCTGSFWNELFDLIRLHGGSLVTLIRERCRREQAFGEQQDRHPTPGWNWWSPTPAMLRQALGFFIGEDAHAPSATGPP